MISLQEKERAILISLVFGIINIFPDISASILSNSNLILADALRGGSELLAIVFSYFAIRTILRGKDMEYNFGYGKLEGFSTLLVATAIVFSLLVIIYNTFHQFSEPQPLQGIGIFIAVVSNFLAVVFSVWQYKKFLRILKTDPSPIIDGQCKLYWTKIVSDGCVLIALVVGYSLSNYTFAHYIDPVGSLLICGFLIYAAYQLYSTSLDNLMDKTLEEKFQLGILRVLAINFEKYLQLHDIRSRRSGGDIYIDLYLEFEPDQVYSKLMGNIQTIKSELEQNIANSQVNIIPVSPS